MDSPEGTTGVEEIVTQSSEQEPTTVDNSQNDAQGQSNEESFFDPNTVPEELLPAYKQMQAAFTKKAQEAAQIRKEAETYKQKADSFSKYERYVPILEEMLSPQNAANQQPAEIQALAQQLKQSGYDESSIEAMTLLGNQLVKIINNQTAAKEQAQFVERVQSQIAEASKLDPRLNDTSLVYKAGDESFTYGQMVEQIVSTTPNWQQDPIGATKKAIARVDALIGKAKQDGQQELSASASAKARQFPTTSSSPQGAKTEGSAKTIQDAFKEAKSELGL